MATIDKSSVREKVEHLKAQFEQLSTEGKLSSEAKVLFSSLLLIVDLILSIFLERQTRKTSGNSSLRSSQTEQDNSSLSGSRGKGKRLRGEAARNASVRQSVTIAQVEQCDVCGEPLTDVPSLSVSIDVVSLRERSVNRAEASHQSTRQQERKMRRFKSAGHAQRFLAVHSHTVRGPV